MSDDFGNDIITLTDEEGNDFEFELLDTLEKDGEVYMAFVPADDESETESEEVVILKVESDEGTGEDMLVTIEDEEVAEEIFQEFCARFEEEEE